MSPTTVICVLPVKNEAWILRHFIEAARAWADVIIIGDHNSRDGSADIAREYDCVTVIPYHAASFDAGSRRKLLLQEARRISGRRLIFVIDADEMLSANWAGSSEWPAMLAAQPGTRFVFDWVEILPGLQNAAIFEQTAAFMDDDSAYQGTVIHEPRTPVTSGPIVHLRDIKLLHYILIDPQRMLSKHRWYKCVETIEIGKRPWATCIMYQDTRPKFYNAPVVPVQPAWLAGYNWLNGYRVKTGGALRTYWFDETVLNYFDQYGTHKFSKLNIWDVDWNKKAELLGRKGNYSDPRSPAEVWIHKFIEKHREDLKLKPSVRLKTVRLLGKTVLRAAGW